MSDDVAKGESLDDFLVNIAEGLSAAQDQLNKNPVKNAFGEDASVYHIPKMEFELQLEMTTESTSSPGALSRLRFKPVRGETSTSTTASSIIKGVMVATPIGGGIPRVALNIVATRRSKRRADVTLTATQANGDPLAGQDVEISVDRVLSDALNAKEGRSSEVSTRTRMETSIVTMDSEGKGVSELQIHSSEPDEHIIAITAAFAGATETLLYRVR